MNKKSIERKDDYDDWIKYKYIEISSTRIVEKWLK